MVCGALKRSSLGGALLTALLVRYHQVIADTSLLALPRWLMLAGSLTEFRTRPRQNRAVGRRFGACRPYSAVVRWYPDSTSWRWL